MNQKRTFYILLLAYLTTPLPSLAASSSANKLLIATAGLTSTLVKRDQDSDLDSRSNNNPPALTLSQQPARSVSLRDKDTRRSRYHNSNHTNDDRDYDCRLCKTTFPRLSEIKTHFTDKHPGKKPFSCEVCHKVYACPYLYENHMEDHHPGTTYSFHCDILSCEEFFASRKDKTEHICTGHKKEEKKIRTKCQTCDQECGASSHVKEHVASSHDEKNEYPCPIKGCTFRLNTEQAQNTHLNNLKRHTKEQIKPFRTCQVCIIDFGCPYKLKKHIASSHDEKNKYPCPNKGCKCRLTSKGAQTKHINKCKWGEKEETKAPLILRCQVCGDLLKSRKGVKVHVDFCHNEKNEYPCPIKGCTFRLNTEQAQNTHLNNLKRHTKEQIKPFRTCQVCIIDFGCPYELKKHIANSHDEKNKYPCPNKGCKCRLTSKATQTKHIDKCKWGEKEETKAPLILTCQYCEKKFKQKKDLEQHERSHKAERPFECKVCHERFRIKDYLEKHQKKHFKKGDFDKIINHLMLRHPRTVTNSPKENATGQGCLEKQHNKSRSNYPADRSVIVTEDDFDSMVDDIMLSQSDKYISESLGKNVRDHVNQNTRRLSYSGQITNDAIPPRLSLSTLDADPNTGFTHFGSSTGSNNSIHSNGQAAGINNNNSSNQRYTHSGLNKNMLSNNFQPINHGTLNPTDAVNQRPMRSFSSLPSNGPGFAASQRQQNHHHHPAPQLTNRVNSRNPNLAFSNNMGVNQNTMHTISATYSSGHSQQYNPLASPSYTLNYHDNHDDLDNFSCMAHDFDTKNISNSTNNLSHTDNNTQSTRNNFDTHYYSNHPTTQANTTLKQSTRNAYQTNNQNNSSNRPYNSNVQQPNNPTYHVDTYVPNAQNHVNNTPHPPSDTSLAPVSNHTYPQNIMSNNAPQPYVQPSHTDNPHHNQTNTAAGSGDNAFYVAPSNNQTNSVQANNQDASLHFDRPTSANPLLETPFDTSSFYTDIPFNRLNNPEAWKTNTENEAITHLRNWSDTASMASFNIDNPQLHLRFDDTNSLADPSFSKEFTAFSPSFSHGYIASSMHSTSHEDRPLEYPDGTKIPPTQSKNTG